MNLFKIPESFVGLAAEALQAFIDESVDLVRTISANPSAFVSADFSSVDLRAEVEAGVAAIGEARAVLASLDVEVTEELSDEDIAAFAEFATAVDEPEAEVFDIDESDDDDDGEGDDAEVAAEEPVVVASAVEPARKQPRQAPPRPSKARTAPEVASAPQVALTAAGALDGYEAGDSFPSMTEIGKVMMARRRNFGLIPDGTRGEKLPIVRASWGDLYPSERRLSGDIVENMELVAAALDQDMITREFVKRRDAGTLSLLASGGLCAPVTPYYQLQMISQATRPVRASLPAFNADRGGIRFARPAGLSSITTAVGIKTAAEDGAGGTEATKTCQVVDCPEFEEVDVDIIFHCLQFGNLGARTFPERVTQWNNLTLAAHARLAESNLLTGIDTASTQVTAADLGLGASSTLPSQILTAAEGYRSRNRMDAEAVLRIMLPSWVGSLLVSDVYRSQFNRFDMNVASFVALLRAGNVEPSFYIDSAAGRNQVFGAQADGALLAFPDTVVWYLFAEGSFLYVDGGVLELGLVRDSVLNSTNDFQIFGETFENVAFVGVESLAVETTVCDSGAVSLPVTVTACGDYSA
jgi:hypothetical protein